MLQTIFLCLYPSEPAVSTCYCSNSLLTRAWKSSSVDFLTEIVYAAVHLRTLSDNTPHPDALHPVLHSSDADQAFILGADTIQIMGYSLGIVRRVADVAVLEIWNWIDGRQMAVSSTKRSVLRSPLNMAIFPAFSIA